MKNKTTNTLVTVWTVLIVLALGVCGVLFGRPALSGNQLETLKLLLIVCGCAAAYCFIVGELARNDSQMDKLWSLLPIVYCWIIAIRGGMKLRLLVFALIVTAWGIRLTVNFARKGAYRLRFWDGVEDYRWAILRAKKPFSNRLVWLLFNLFFISIYQNALVLAICLPALAGMESAAPFGWIDGLAAALAIGFLTLETVADEQQWRFHQNKNRLLSEKKEPEALPAPYDLGFNTVGLWRRMRHPNYLGEQGIWLSLFGLAVGAGVTAYGVLHWTLVGPLLLVLLFVGSSALGESISAKKYPKYADYQAQVFKYLPLRAYQRKDSV